MVIYVDRYLYILQLYFYFSFVFRLHFFLNWKVYQG